jgi:quinol monooxygenase YgiN
MFFYQLEISVKENKVDEFVASLRSLSKGFRKEQGCLDFVLWRDTENINIFSVVADWKTRQTMEDHFKDKNFEVMLGAAKVLGDKFEMSTGEASEKGDFQMARDKVSLRP